MYNETVNLQSVMTALTTLYAAHKYMCPGLAKIVVKYLKENLTEKNVLLVLQHICLYCSASSPSTNLGGGGGGGHAHSAAEWEPPVAESQPRRAYFPAQSSSEPISTTTTNATLTSASRGQRSRRPRERGVFVDEEDEYEDLHSPSAPPLEHDPLLFGDEDEEDDDDEEESLISFSRLGVLLRVYTLSPANPREEWGGIIILLSHFQHFDESEENSKLVAEKKSTETN